uniref:Uncharacterized protein LOC104218485 n=1 Tax=Nicotiana sylvestris TaxID=4096 RepID=A0A1U7VY19_NICSY|nr:PREDICTED: uncharacterized protein LOC104218485 [Nicotiana sylvestris]
MVSVFLQAQEADYYQNIMSAMGKPFAEAIKIGEMVENGLKIGRILSQSAIRATSKAIQDGSGGVANRKKKEEAAMTTSSVRKPRPLRPYFSERTPQYYYPHQDVAYAMPVPQTRQNPASPAYRAGTRCAYHSGVEGNDTDDCWTLKRAVENLIEKKRIVLKDEDVPNPMWKRSQGLSQNKTKGRKRVKPTPQNTEKKEETETGVAPSKDVVLYVPRGPKKEQMSLSSPRRFELNKGSKMYMPKGTYVVQGPIIPPRLNEPMVIGHAPQRPMTDPTVVPWNYNKAVVTYRGKKISGEVKENNSVEKYLNLEEVNNATKKRFPPKKPVSAEKAKEFFRKMKMADYEIIDQLRKSPAQVFLLSLLMNSTEHQKVLIKTLNEAYVPIETTVEQLERMAERVMLDGGSGVDICPLSTLQRMEIGTKRIKPNNVCVHAFDGIKRDIIGEIDLILTIGPVDFEVLMDEEDAEKTAFTAPWGTYCYKVMPFVYVTRTAIKAQALADHLAENPIDNEYQPFSTYFPDKECQVHSDLVHAPPTELHPMSAPWPFVA